MAALRSIGITPDALILRSDRDVPEPLKNKIALMCDVDIDGVISTPDAPVDLRHPQGAAPRGTRRLRGAPAQPAVPRRRLDHVGRPVAPCARPGETVRIALVGKYIDLSDAYLSVAEALRAGGFAHRAKVEMRWVASDDCETDSGAATALADMHAVLIPGGFGIRGIEGKIGCDPLRPPSPASGARLCLGLQCIVIEAARSVGLTGANSAEFDPTPRSGDLDDGRSARRGRR